MNMKVFGMPLLIGVLGAVNPHVYAGSEPRAGEFLLQAAATLERGFADEPLLLRRALGDQLQTNDQRGFG